MEVEAVEGEEEEGEEPETEETGGMVVTGGGGTLELIWAPILKI